jgi:hypothetical protein
MLATTICFELEVRRRHPPALGSPPRANAARCTRRAERWPLLWRRAPDPGGVDAKPLLVLNCHSCRHLSDSTGPVGSPVFACAITDFVRSLFGIEA